MLFRAHRVDTRHHRDRHESVYRHDGPLWHRVAGYTGNVTVRAEPFDAIELDLWRRRTLDLRLKEWFASVWEYWL